MDVRCEKCQTEYELDENRLKPGGVTVKCTNCGHMFKIRKRSNTNVGVPAVAAAADPRSRPVSSKQPLTSDRPARADSMGDAPLRITDAPSGPSSERQWLVRLENGETRTCRELATLQQWIVAGAVSRESLISRTGKTWKRLGDIAELGQYFVIADEARAQRTTKPTGKPPAASTIIGVGTLHPPDDDDEGHSTGNFRAQPVASQPAAPPPSPPRVSPIAQTELAPSGSVPVPAAPAPAPAPPPRVKPPSNAGRQTAAWVGGEIKASDSMAEMPQGPRGSKLAGAIDEPAFAGRVRMEPSSSPFETGRVRIDDDDAVIATSRGSRAGMWIALVSLLVIGAAAGAIYMLVFKSRGEPVALATSDAGVAELGDATAISVTPLDAQAAASPLDGAAAELVAGVFARMQSTLDGLKGSDDPASLAMRARLATALAQGMEDRADFVDRAEADKLRKNAKQIVIDAAPLAQRAVSGQAASASANLAMADVLRLQGKPAPAVKRYLDSARAKAAGDAELLASVALGEAQLAMRDGKLPEAGKALAGIAAPDDMRVKLALAQLAYTQHETTGAKSQVDQVLATQPDNDVALAMYGKLETAVATSDPLPPEDGSAPKPEPNDAAKPTNHGGGGAGGAGGGDYDSLLARANKQALSNCSKAMDLYMKALEQKPNGVEALTGMGYCHLDAKQFSSAFSKFRAALAVSSRFEPALGGVAETYQRQGNKEAAIAAWRKYLDVYPTSAKAKKQLEILGASEQPKETPAAPTEQPQKTPEKKTEQPQKATETTTEQPQKPAETTTEQPVVAPGSAG